MSPENEKEYEPMPVVLLDLIKEQRAEAIRATQQRLEVLEKMTPIQYAGAIGIDLFVVPSWIQALCGNVTPPSIQAWPTKGPGWWMVRSGNREWYAHHEEILKTIKENT